jgi:hypothetical protein
MAVADLTADRHVQMRVELHQVFGADQHKGLTGDRQDVEIGDLVEPAGEQFARRAMLDSALRAATGEREQSQRRAETPHARGQTRPG